MKKKIALGDVPIMFGDIKGCGACQMQNQIIKSTCTSPKYKYVHSPLDKPARPFLKNMGIPTWYVPTGNGSGFLHEGVIRKSIKVNGRNLNLCTFINQTTSSRRRKTRSNLFGETVPQINSLQKYGKNFPDGNQFNIGNNYLTDVTNKWGDPLLAGTLGREFGPGNTDKIYTNNYYNDIRMGHPGGDLGSALNLNRSCNLYNSVPSPSGKPADPVVNYPGLIYDSPNQQIVNMTGFGRYRRKSRSRGGSKKSILQKRRTKLKRFLKHGPLKRKMKGSKHREHNSRVGKMFHKNKPKWKAELKRIEKKLKQLKKKKSKSKSKSKSKRKSNKKSIVRRSRFGNLYYQMGPVPIQPYLMDKNTFDNNFAGGGQSSIPRPNSVSNSKLYIGQVKPYYPIESTTSFGMRVKKSPKIIKKMNVIKKENKKKKIHSVVKHSSIKLKSIKLNNSIKSKKPKIKFVKSKEEIKQRKSKKPFDQSIPKIKEGSTISVNSFGKIQVH